MQDLMDLYSTACDEVPVYIEDLICDVVEEYDLEKSKATVSFVIETKCERPMWIMGNYRRLSILFYNIYKNAVDLMETKGEIFTTVERTDKGRILVKITAAADRVAEPKNNLAMAIAKRIAMEYFGFITTESLPTGGLSFYIVLGKKQL